MSSRVVLCIHDDPRRLQRCRSRLAALGYAAEGAAGVPNAIALLERTKIAAVLLEYNPEAQDAEIVAMQIKERFPNQPIILVSVQSDVPERMLWLVDGYLQRSDSTERLRAVLERVSPYVGKYLPQSTRLGVPRTVKASAN